MKINKYIILISLLTLAWACGKKATKPTTHSALITLVVGKDIKVITPAGEKTAKAGEVLQVKDVVVTGAKTQADIQFSDGVAIKLGQKSRLSLTDMKITQNGSEDSISLEKGSMFAKVSKMNKGSGFQVKTQTAVAAVRGTEFLAESEGNESKIAVTEGKVEVSSNTGETKVVEEGQQVEVDTTGKVESEKIDPATEAKTKGMSLIKQLDTDSWNNVKKIMDDQKGLLEKAGKKEDFDKFQKDMEQKIQDKIKTDDKRVEDLKKSGDDRVKSIQEGTYKKSQETQQKTQEKIDQLKNENVDEAKKKAEDLFKKFQ